MNIFEEKNSENWPKTVNFAQSFEWGDIALAEKQKVIRLVFKEDDGGRIMAVAQIIYKTLPFGWRYAWCPKGPVSVIPTEAESRVEGSLKVRISRDFCAFAKASAGTQSTSLRFARNDNDNVYEVLADYLKNKKCIFLRCEPDKLPSGVKLLPAKDVNPKVTVVLDLQKNNEDRSEEH